MDKWYNLENYKSRSTSMESLYLAQYQIVYNVIFFMTTTLLGAFIVGRVTGLIGNSLIKIKQSK